MRAAIERLARRWWAGELGWRGLALRAAVAPLSWAWAGAGSFRARRALRRSSERVSGLLVVSVGNLAVGGTGKTPLSAWVARRTADAGVRTAVLVGGTGEDEALLHRRWNPDVQVLSGRSRAASVREAVARGAQAAVLDDGFQHFALARDLDVVLLSADDPFPGPVLPAGPYREPPAALSRADAVVVTRRLGTLQEADSLAAHARRFAPEAVSAGALLSPSRLVTLGAFSRATVGEPTGVRGEEADAGQIAAVLAVCGVARAEAFRVAVARTVAGPVELQAFPDHYGYEERDVARLLARAEGRPIVVTAKDAVKLEVLPGALESVYVLGEELQWDWGREDLESLITERALKVIG